MMTLPLARRLPALLLLGPAAFAAAQSAPSVLSAPSTVGAPGVGGLSAMAPAGQLNYSISLSDSAIVGYNGGDGVANSVNLAGNAGFVSSSERHPTSFIYSGGYLFGSNGQPNTSFQNLGISQVLNTRQWTFLLSDVVSYLPATPRFGLAGVPGVGDTGSLPIGAGTQGATDAVLTNYGQRVTNTTTGSADHRFSSRTTGSAFASYTKQYFFGDLGLNSNFLSVGGQLARNLSATTLVGGGYTYTSATYPGLNYGFVSHGVSGIFQHTFNGRTSMNGSIGPQWTSSTGTALFPNRLSVAASLSVNYLAGLNNYYLSYSRGTNPGSGVLLGAVSDYVSLGAQRRFDRNWSGGAYVSYSHSSTLATNPLLSANVSAFTAGLQASRRISNSFSAFASYAVQHQLAAQVLLNNNAFNGTAHIISAGITYSPRPIHLGRR